MEEEPKPTAEQLAASERAWRAVGPKIAAMPPDKRRPRLDDDDDASKK